MLTLHSLFKIKMYFIMKHVLIKHVLCIFVINKILIMITADQLKDIMEREKALRGYL